MFQLSTSLPSIDGEKAFTMIIIKGTKTNNKVNVINGITNNHRLLWSFWNGVFFFLNSKLIGITFDAV